ncbi:MAG: tRNA 2-thiouridine(34) synthase MnmA, partial [Emergencia sp.]|nr:tRNA 2-thiouridine(34) synthase MnmA [Emergencia sp.]
AAKDQTYALCNLTQDQLAHTLMPLGEYTKEEVRAMAEKIGIDVANKPDSQEICFIPDHDYAAFIERETGGKVPPEGNFVNPQGEVLGRHRGIIHYTIGQRKGLGIAFGKPVFVSEIRPETNEVVLGDNEDIFKTELLADHINWMSVGDPTDGMRLNAKIRYAHKGAPCMVYPEPEGKVRVVFEEPQRAITPGQSVVFYDGDLVAGGGVIL